MAKETLTLSVPVTVALNELEKEEILAIHETNPKTDYFENMNVKTHNSLLSSRPADVESKKVIYILDLGKTVIALDYLGELFTVLR